MYLFFLERYPHGIFAAGGAYVPKQEKKRDLRSEEITKFQECLDLMPST